MLLPTCGEERCVTLLKTAARETTYDAESGNRTRATLVGDERSHHCANPAPRASYLDERTLTHESIANFRKERYDTCKEFPDGCERLKLMDSCSCLVMNRRGKSEAISFFCEYILICFYCNLMLRTMFAWFLVFLIATSRRLQLKMSVELKSITLFQGTNGRL